MEPAYTVAQIRAAEAAAMAGLGPDVLMQRAAAGLAAAVLRGCGPAAPTARGCCWSSAPATTAATRSSPAPALPVAASRSPPGAPGARARSRLGGLPGRGGRELDARRPAHLPRQRLRHRRGAGIGVASRAGPGGGRVRRGLPDLGVPVVAVDLPSGLAPEPPFGDEPHFTADLTVTFGGYKLCQLLEPARSACGESKLVDIGLELPEPTVSGGSRRPGGRLARARTPRSDKYSRGVVGLDTGSVDYPGAAVLVAAGAVGAGAGMVRYLGPPRSRPLIDRFPNVVSARVGCRPSLSVVGGASARIRRGERAVEAGVPLVVDADALRYLPDRRAIRRCADPACRRIGSAARRRACRGRGRPAQRRCGRGCPNGLHGAAEGRHPVRAPRARTGSGSLFPVRAGRRRRGPATFSPGPAGRCSRRAAARPGRARRGEHPGADRGAVSRSAAPADHCCTQFNVVGETCENSEALTRVLAFAKRVGVSLLAGGHTESPGRATTARSGCIDVRVRESHDYRSTAQKGSARVAVQKFGTFLSGMIMPNIAAFIAWGIITAFFIPTGWPPNATIATIVGPMITYLLPMPDRLHRRPDGL